MFKSVGRSCAPYTQLDFILIKHFKRSAEDGIDGSLRVCGGMNYEAVVLFQLGIQFWIYAVVFRSVFSFAMPAIAQRNAAPISATSSSLL